MKRITSRQNALVATCRGIARGQDRTTILLDGPHLVGEAIAAGLDVRQIVVTGGATGRSDVQTIVEAAERAGIEQAAVSPSVMTAISPVRTPSGVVAIAGRPVYTADRVYDGGSPLVLVACDVQDPGNLGAIVRVAESAGASGMVAAGSSADPFGWKALRGSMGSALRLPILVQPDIAEGIAEARRRHCRLAAAVPRDGVNVFETPLTGALAVLIGGEGPGLPRAAVEEADFRVSIPMAVPVESLNTAVATALILYEARRQRHRTARS